MTGHRNTYFCFAGLAAASDTSQEDNGLRSDLTITTTYYFFMRQLYYERGTGVQRSMGWPLHLLFLPYLSYFLL